MRFPPLLMQIDNDSELAVQMSISGLLNASISVMCGDFVKFILVSGLFPISLSSVIIVEYAKTLKANGSVSFDFLV
jgi:hypothetical protein